MIEYILIIILALNISIAIWFPNSRPYYKKGFIIWGNFALWFFKKLFSIERKKKKKDNKKNKRKIKSVKKIITYEVEE